jgi:hypothetical protein
MVIRTVAIACTFHPLHSLPAALATLNVAH